MEAAYYSAPPGWIGGTSQRAVESTGHVRLLDPKTRRPTGARTLASTSRSHIAFLLKTRHKKTPFTTTQQLAPAAPRMPANSIGVLAKPMNTRKRTARRAPHNQGVPSLPLKKYGAAAVTMLFCRAFLRSLSEYLHICPPLSRTQRTSATLATAGRSVDSPTYAVSRRHRTANSIAV